MMSELAHENIKFAGASRLGYLSYDQLHEYVEVHTSEATDQSERLFTGEPSIRKVEIVAQKAFNKVAPSSLRVHNDSPEVSYANKYLLYERDDLFMDGQPIASIEIGIHDEELGDLINLDYLYSRFSDKRRRPKLTPQVKKVFEGYMATRIDFMTQTEE